MSDKTAEWLFRRKNFANAAIFCQIDAHGRKTKRKTSSDFGNTERDWKAERMAKDIFREYLKKM